VQGAITRDQGTGGNQGPGDTYLLERQRVYKHRVKHLVRKHRAAVAMQKCQQWRTDRNAFWRSYKPQGATCPFPASKLAEHFKIKMNSWDQTATSPAPTDPQHNIDVTSPSAGLGEIVAAFSGAQPGCFDGSLSTDSKATRSSSPGFWRDLNP
jgi:hypothetical protein